MWPIEWSHSIWLSDHFYNDFENIVQESIEMVHNVASVKLCKTGNSPVGNWYRQTANILVKY